MPAEPARLAMLPAQKQLFIQCAFPADLRPLALPWQQQLSALTTSIRMRLISVRLKAGLWGYAAELTDRQQLNCIGATLSHTHSNAGLLAHSLTCLAVPCRWFFLFALGHARDLLVRWFGRQAKSTPKVGLGLRLQASAAQAWDTYPSTDALAA